MVVIDRQRGGIVALTDREEGEVPPVVAVKDAILPLPRVRHRGHEPAPLVAAPLGQHDMRKGVLRPALSPVQLNRAP